MDRPMPLYGLGQLLRSVCLTVKGLGAREELEQQDAEGKDVSRSGDVPAPELFRTGVAGRHGCMRNRELLGSD